MKISTLGLALLLTVAVAGDAAAQRFVNWQYTMPQVHSAAPNTYYTIPYNWYQSHWIYSYMPYGNFGPWGYSTYPYGVQYGYLPQTYAAPAIDFGPPARSRSSLYPAVPYSEFAAEEQQRSSERRGYINVTVPTADTKVWINGKLMTQTGKERSFMTPLLESTAKSYSFDLKVRWTDDFGEREQQLPTALQVRAGETRDVVFPLKK